MKHNGQLYVAFCNYKERMHKQADGNLVCFRETDDGECEVPAALREVAPNLKGLLHKYKGLQH